MFTRVEEKRAIVREEGGPELKGRGIPLAVRILAHGNATFAGLELSPARHVLEDTLHQIRPKIDAGDASLLMGSIN